MELPVRLLALISLAPVRQDGPGEFATFLEYLVRKLLQVGPPVRMGVPA